MFVTALVALAFAQAKAATAPEPAVVGVVLVSRRAGADDYAKKVAVLTATTLRNEGIDGVIDDSVATKRIRAAGHPDPRTCASAKPCLARLAFLLGKRGVVVGVDVGRIQKQLVVTLDAVASWSGESLQVVELTTRVDNFAEDASVGLTGFARALKDKLDAADPGTPPVAARTEPASELKKPTPPAPDAPLADSSGSTVSGSGVSATAHPAKRSPGVARWAFLGGTVVFAGVTAAFGALGFSAKSTIDANRYDAGGVVGTHLTQAELQAKAGQANTFIPLTIAGAATTALLAAVTAYFFFRGDEP